MEQKLSDVALWSWVDEELCLLSAIVRKIIFGDGFNAENRAKIKWDFFLSPFKWDFPPR